MNDTIIRLAPFILGLIAFIQIYRWPILLSIHGEQLASKDLPEPITYVSIHGGWTREDVRGSWIHELAFIPALFALPDDLVVSRPIHIYTQPDVEIIDIHWHPSAFNNALRAERHINGWDLILEKPLHVKHLPLLTVITTTRTQLMATTTNEKNKLIDSGDRRKSRATMVCLAVTSAVLTLVSARSSSASGNVTIYDYLALFACMAGCIACFSHAISGIKRVAKKRQARSRAKTSSVQPDQTPKNHINAGQIEVFRTSVSRQSPAQITPLMQASRTEKPRETQTTQKVG